MLSQDIKNLSARAATWRFGVTLMPDDSADLAANLYDLVQQAEALEIATPPYGLPRTDDDASVSDPLEALRSTFAEYSSDMIKLGPRAIAIMRATLNEAADLAAKMEAMPSLPNSVKNEDGVVDLANWQGHRGRTVGHVVMPAPDYEGELGVDEPSDPGVVA